MSTDLLRELPSIDELLRSPEIACIPAPATALKNAARAALEQLRRDIRSGTITAAQLSGSLSDLPQRIADRLELDSRYSLRPVINASGVILHTNLGRAPLSSRALDHIYSVAARYNNLEYSIADGARGKRDTHLDRLFAQIFADPRHAEHGVRGIVVNNCAAATILALNTLAAGGEVIVSRGELVEIGGSFRIPDVMQKSGAILREVGTTNRTRIADYERAITPNTRLLMRVHRSNFAITGFTEQPSLEQLARLARKYNLPLFEDQGNGSLVDLRALNPAIHGEAPPTAIESLQGGAHIISFSGDKLLGGPQAGILAGHFELIAQMRANPFFRAMRVDKLTYAALEATLLAYTQQDFDSLPILRMVRLTADGLRARSEAFLARLNSAAPEHNQPSQLTAQIIPGDSVIGGGTAPTATIPTSLIALTHSTLNADSLERALRSGTQPPHHAASTPVITRIESGRVLLDLRTVLPDEEPALLSALLALN